MADALMQHLPPPVGPIWLRSDLDQLEARMGLRFQRQAEHIDARVHAEINRLLLFLFPTVLSVLGLAALLGKLA